MTQRTSQSLPTGSYGHRSGQPLPTSTHIDVPHSAGRATIPSAAATLSTSPTATTTTSLPSSPSKTSGTDIPVAYYYDSSTYPPPEHSYAAGRGKPSLGPFQKQLEASRNRHRRRSQSMEPKRQGLTKQRTQTAAVISAAAGEMSNWDRSSGNNNSERTHDKGGERAAEGKGSRGKSSRTGRSNQSTGRNEDKGRLGGKPQVRERNNIEQLELVLKLSTMHRRVERARRYSDQGVKRETKPCPKARLEG